MPKALGTQVLGGERPVRECSGLHAWIFSDPENMLQSLSWGKIYNKRAYSICLEHFRNNKHRIRVMDAEILVPVLCP